jgi:hypothetical protein
MILVMRAFDSLPEQWSGRDARCLSNGDDARNARLSFGALRNRGMCFVACCT